ASCARDGGEAVESEYARAVGDRVSALPAEGRALRGAEGLAHEDVVVEGKKSEAEAGQQQMSLGAGGEHRSPRAHPPLLRRDRNVEALGPEGGHPRTVEDAHA